MRTLRILPIIILTAAALSLPGTAAAGGSLAGRWAGTIADSAHRQHIEITINARETGGTWRLGSRCYGTETLDSISGGYHHYLRHLGRGASCRFAGEIDCLEPAAGGIYDAVTTHLGGTWGLAGTLRRA